MYLLDRNVYIRAFTHPADVADFQSFHRQQLPRILLSAVVVHELLVGATAPDRETPDRERSDRTLPRPRAHSHSRPLDLEAGGGRGSSASGARDISGSPLQRSFANDLLLAATARELGATLLTYNTRDFLLIARVMPLTVALPWPATRPY